MIYCLIKFRYFLSLCDGSLVGVIALGRNRHLLLPLYYYFLENCLCYTAKIRVSNVFKNEYNLEIRKVWKLPLEITQKKIWYTSGQALVTQPMLQRRPNWTELRSMDSYIQILCRFQKCKPKVPQPSLLRNEKPTFNPPCNLDIRIHRS